MVRAAVEILPDHWTNRPDTFDEDIFRCAVEHNEYGLPDRFDDDDWIIDVGAHIGSFAWACAIRGAGQVDAFEPEPENFGLLMSNMLPIINTVHCHNAAVWRSDRVESLYYHRNHDPRNTGGGDAFADHDGPILITVGLDAIVDRPVRLLKLDCEGSEFPILYTSRKLDLVQEIVGEYHTDRHQRRNAIVTDLDFTPQALERWLVAQGFTVDIEEKEPHLGLFRAVR